MNHEPDSTSSRTLLTAEFLGTAAGRDEMSITRDLIAIAHARAGGQAASTAEPPQGDATIASG